jgi:hypothetical protein
MTSLFKGKKINLAILEAYKSIHGDFKIPPNFIVPKSPEWPDLFHNSTLGRYADNVRQILHRHPKYYVENDQIELRKIGFDQTMKVINNERILLGLKAYKDKHGNCEVPLDFKVSLRDTTWPKETRGLNLGAILQHIKMNKRMYEPIQQPLIDLGIQMTNGIEFELVYDALISFGILHGHLRVPQTFVVPDDDENYSFNTWGLKLGEALKSIRNGIHLTILSVQQQF